MLKAYISHAKRHPFIMMKGCLSQFPSIFFIILHDFFHHFMDDFNRFLIKIGG
jgi:hypothetical protein